MKAIVLSGGGSKGSYQIGVWKALKKLHIKYDIVTGTSVGALNGALFVQNNYFKSIRLWKKINMELLFGKGVKTPNRLRDLISIYGKNFIKNGGMDVKNLENIIAKYLNKKKFYKSKIDFGLVTVDVSNKKAIQLKKSEIEEDKLIDYLMASASCYPAFKAKDIDGNKHIDGGFFDNLPINLAIDLGADSVIAIDLSAPGLKVKQKKDIDIVTIKPKNKLSNFLNFNEKDSIRNIKLGYNDTMKVFNKYKGNKFTFKKKNMDKLLDEYSQVFMYNFNQILNTDKLTNAFNLDLININNIILNLSEDLGYIFNINDTKIYNYKKFNKLLLKNINKNELNKKCQKVINIYKKIKNKDYKYLRIKGILSPKEFLYALYLYTLEEV